MGGAYTVMENIASGLHIAVGKKALGSETNRRDIKMNSQDIETNGRGIETYDRDVEMYWWMTVLRMMGSSNWRIKKTYSTYC
ncbi:hypothetical protein Tco_0689410 [Tanacetum coccineum]